MRKYLSTLSNFDLGITAFFTLLYAIIIALITGPTSNGPSFFENVYLMIGISILFTIIGGLYLGEIIFRLIKHFFN